MGDRSWRRLLQHASVTKVESDETQPDFSFFQPYKHCTLHREPISAVQVKGACSLAVRNQEIRQPECSLCGHPLASYRQ